MELRSHTRGVFHWLLPSCCGCVDQFAAGGSRTTQHLMRGCASTRMSEATTSAAVPMVKELRKRIRCKHFALTMAQQTVRHQSIKKVTPGCYPMCSVRIGREQHVPDSINCTQNQTSRVGVDCGAAHALPVLPTAPFPHALKSKKNAFADTAPAESP